MTYEEQVERVRQAIMRYRELMDLLHSRTATAERNYERLFEPLTPDQRETLSEKLRQREAAIHALKDMEPLRRAVMQIRFAMRDFEREFDQIATHIAPEED